MQSKTIDSYSKAGVNLQKIRSLQTDIGNSIKKSYSFQRIGEVISGFGHYSGLIKLESNVIALHSDGVGTKVLISQKLKRFDTIGIDCIAMNVNDIICTGSEPFGFVDYIGLKSPNQKMVNNLMKGLVEGAKTARVAIIGGETAVVSDLISGNSEYAFDISGTAIGFAKYDQLILGNNIKIEDRIIGVESNGLHSNGFTLARKVLSKYPLSHTPRFLTKSIGEELLLPTRIYVRPVLEIIQNSNIVLHGLAHITGGSFSKLKRLNKKMRFNLSNLPSPKGIFKQIQRDGKIDTTEMYNTFNMGIGFCLVVPKKYVDKAIDIFDKYNMPAFEIGKIDSKDRGGVVGNVEGKKYVFS